MSFQNAFTLSFLEWCEIPAGKVTIQNVVYDVPQFYIAMYPVTVEQYEAFMKDNGYSNQSYWTNEGWSWKATKTHPVRPGWWNRSRVNTEPDHPVIGMSWYEAVAFTNWLSAKMQANIRLPTLQQWQRAAQGDDGRKYPWGNDYDENRSNNERKFQSEDEIKSRIFRDAPRRVKWDELPKTTPVTQYPNGASPFGVMDMCGNAGEWCLSSRIIGDKSYTIGGGEGSVQAVCSNYWRMQLTEVTEHFYAYAGDRHMGIGFRVCAIPAP